MKYKAKSIEELKRISKSLGEKIIVVEPYLSSRNGYLFLCLRIESNVAIYEKTIDRKFLPNLQNFKDKKFYLEAVTKAIENDFSRFGFSVKRESLKELSKYPVRMGEEDISYLFRIVAERNMK